MKKQSINWNKGLYRIWIIASLIWIALLLWAGIDDGDVLKNGDFWAMTFLTPIGILFGFFILREILIWIYKGFK